MCLKHMAETMPDSSCCTGDENTCRRHRPVTTLSIGEGAPAGTNRRRCRGISLRLHRGRDRAARRMAPGQPRRCGFGQSARGVLMRELAEIITEGGVRKPARPPAPPRGDRARDAVIRVLARPAVVHNALAISCSRLRTGSPGSSTRSPRSSRSRRSTPLACNEQVSPGRGQGRRPLDTELQHPATHADPPHLLDVKTFGDQVWTRSLGSCSVAGWRIKGVSASAARPRKTSAQTRRTTGARTTPSRVGVRLGKQRRSASPSVFRTLATTAELVAPVR